MAPTPQEAVSSYVTDMLSLEDHIETALKAQIEDTKQDTSLVGELEKVRRTCRDHINALTAMTERRTSTGQGLSTMVKRTASTLLGVGAAAVDFVRGEKVPKNLRDDYAAVSLAVVGYSMLHSAAIGLGDTEAATLSLEHLKGHARSVMTPQGTIPVAVLQFLREDGHTIAPDALATIEANIQDAWAQQSTVSHAAR